MKYTDLQDLIRAHYTSEDDFHNIIDKIIKAEIGSGKEISGNKIRATFNHYAGKKRDGYTIKPLKELTALNKANERMCEIRKSDISLQNVIAPTVVIDTVNTVLEEYKNRDKLKQYGLEISNKILFNGPPGVGKTWTALAIAGELNLDLVFVRWDTLISSYLGSTGSNIKKIFDTANNEPVMLFLDEFDAIGQERGANHNEVGEMNRVVINTLQNIDLFSPDSFLVAATNHGHLLDSAIWRRFTVVNMDLPGENERRKLILHYSKGLPLEIYIEEWVKDTQGMSGADIKQKIHKEAKQYILNSTKAKMA